MMRRLSLSLVILLLVASLSFSEIFSFKYQKGDKYKMITNVYQDIYVDGRYSHSAESMYKISVEILDIEGNSGYIAGTYFITESGEDVLGLFAMVESEQYSEFWRDSQGFYTIDPGYFYPAVRNIPIFLEGSIDIGDTWTETAEEVQDQRAMGIEEPVRIPIDVQYIYQGKEIIDGTEVAVFNISYDNVVNYDDVPATEEISVIRVYGQVNQIYYWDIARGRPYQYNEEFSFLFIYSNGIKIRFEGFSEGIVIQSEELDEDQVTEDIQDQIEEEGLEDVTVRSEEGGVVITLENIQFQPDSAELMPSEIEKLKKIGEILEQYPGRDLLITGHTAFIGIMFGLQELSEQRAAAVADFLIQLGVRDETEIMIQGKGPDEPIGDNSTEEGRRKNRRVEIKILEN